MQNQTFKLSLKPNDYPPNVPFVYADQYDEGRTFVATVYDADGSLYNFNGETVTVVGTKPSGTGFSYTATASGNTVTFETTGQMTVVAGNVTCGIIIEKDGDRIGTLHFILHVQPAALSADTIIDSNDFGRIISDAVAEYMEEHGIVIDPTLTVAGAAADAKATGDAIDELKSAIEDVSGLSDEAKEALLACFQNVAWIGDDGQDYYDALEAALYPPPELVSISAVYTQSGTVYDTDTLDSLKSDLVVTATYDDSSSEAVTTYTLSGTLTVGTSTVTVSYGGKTTTFNVTVTEYQFPYLYNWDFTQSLTDSVENVTVESASGREPTRDSTGLIFSAALQQIVVPVSLDMSGKTLEIDVASMVFAGSTSNHIRFIMLLDSATSSNGNGVLIFRNTGVWNAYGFTSASGSTTNWMDNWSSDSANTGNNRINAISGKTVKIVFDENGNTMTLYFDDVVIGTQTRLYFINQGMRYLMIGGSYGGQQSAGNQFFNATITGMRIYNNQ